MNYNDRTTYDSKPFHRRENFRQPAFGLFFICCHALLPSPEFLSCASRPCIPTAMRLPSSLSLKQILGGICNPLFAMSAGKKQSLMPKKQPGYAAPAQVKTICSKRPVGLLHPQILAETGPSPGFQPRSVRPAPESGDLPMSSAGTGWRQRAHDRSCLIPAKGSGSLSRFACATSQRRPNPQ